MQYDRHLFMTMVERWSPKSHCFHLPFGKATITLQDVQVLFDLRVDGHPIYLANIFGRGRSWHAMLEALTGYVRPINGKSFVWCWERILPLQPGLYELKDDNAALPYAMIWTRGVERNTESHHTLISIRDQIDHITKVQPLEWKPKHFDVDLRTRVDQSLVDLLGYYFTDWRDRHGKLVVPVHSAVLRDYTLWYLSHGWLLIGKPSIKSWICSSAGSFATLSRGLHKILKILKEVQKDLAHALWGYEIESVVKQIFEEARDAIPPDGPFCDAESSYYNVNSRGRGEGQGRGRGCGRPRG
ncbi:putative nudix hydrolase 18, mitochondrial-like [Capsicum annuum]|nr:putative nudix hydrolase 18, mitochondrial-like [Capsicum annuum]